ncbi:MAG: glutamate 5-kinase [Candidatus Desulfovibrio kirbyi]|uniref:Glutamate 5-kinase n=1 Tax=Candidatus Desulfovibrio kirbyi TaxID=2696086 RepID=A0A6L2R6N3_9BACT|nr:MAG: glutamate 5-kinase [Candidatus Desulfovibrio kirbyi]
MSAEHAWQQERAHALEHARTVLVKIGSAVLSDSSGLAVNVMQSIARQLATLRALPKPPAGARRFVLVSSGAVAAGRAALKTQQIAGQGQTLASGQAAASVGQGLLMREWENAFAAHNMLTAQILLTRDDFRARARARNARNTFTLLLNWGVIPVVNENDTVSVNELKFGDNDCLASLLLELIGADLFVNLTSAAGVFAADPRKMPDAPIIEHIEDVTALNLTKVCGSKTAAGSGGMYSKLLAARRAAQIGVPTLILSGRVPDVLTRAFALTSEETGLGTWVCASRASIPRRKFRLAYQNEPVGSVDVDTGAMQALVHKGSSLLPGGVRQVSGSFHQGALVRITHEGKNLGVGISNYSAADLQKIMGLKRPQVADVLCVSCYPEVIHRDYLLLDAAV